MNTINISLTKDQVNTVNELTKKLGFANRSEFFRALIRKATSDASEIEKLSTFPFAPPKFKNASKIMSEFKKSGKYSGEFLSELEEGLKSSNYFEK